MDPSFLLRQQRFLFLLSGSPYGFVPVLEQGLEKPGRAIADEVILQDHPQLVVLCLLIVSQDEKVISSDGALLCCFCD